MRKAMILGVVTLASALASPAVADEFTGFRLGLLMSSDKLDGYYNHSIVAPSPTTTVNDSKRFGYEVFGGWALNKWIAIEGGFHSGSEFDKNVFPAFVESLDTSLPPDSTDGSEYYILRQKVQSANVSAVGSWWIGNKFAVFGRAGFMAWRGEVAYSFGDIDPEFKIQDHRRDNGFAPLFGGGIQTQLDHALIRLEYQQADLGDLAFGSNFSSTENIYSSLALSIVWTL